MAPVHLAASTNHVEKLRRLLDEDPGLIEAELCHRSPLLYASEAGSVGAVRLLLDRGADANKKDDSGWTALMWACYAGRVAMASLLLAHGADPSVRDGAGQTVLMLASYGGHKFTVSNHVAVIRLLIKDGRVPVDACDGEGRTALWWACNCGFVGRARVLLVEGFADRSLADFQGVTPLGVAWALGREDSIRLLQWYEGELEKPFLLSKARAVVDATAGIMQAPLKSQAMTQAEEQRAREEAAPAWLLGRVGRGEALPVLWVAGHAGQHHDDEEERFAVCEWLARCLAEDLLVEVLEGLPYR